MIFTGDETMPEAIQQSFAQMLLKRIAATPDVEALRYPDENEDWQSYTWAESGAEAEVLAAGLIALGVGPQERVAIASETSINWILAAFGITLAGAAMTTVYASTGAADVAFILSDSNSKVVFVENHNQLAKVLEKRDNLPELSKAVLFDGEGDGDFSISLEQLRELGRDALAADADLVKNRSEAITGDQLATLIYTSGTTGKPKGVELLHSSWGYVGSAMTAVGLMETTDVELRWLPMAHVFGTVLMTAHVQFGYSAAVDGRIPNILGNISLVKPTFMGAVPRIFEKVHAAVSAMAKAGGPEQEAKFNQAIDIAKKHRALMAAGQEIPPELEAGFQVADEKVLAMVRAVLGGRIRFFISGSAPLSAEIAEFFAAAGMPVLEGYGLTETAALATLCRPGSMMFGTVGQSWPGTEIQIAPDGEILMRGPSVMRGYRNRPDATAEVLDADGWFSTGDIGEFDDMGHLKITDRKKDLFKTSGGKYIAPSAIETQFKAVCGLASNLVVHANNRKFVSAIVTLDPDASAGWATARGKPADIASLSEDPELVAAIQGAVDELNEGLNHWERVQKFVVLDHDFSVEDGEITPSLKVKRKVIEERNKKLLDSFYA